MSIQSFDELIEKCRLYRSILREEVDTNNDGYEKVLNDGIGMFDEIQFFIDNNLSSKSQLKTLEREMEDIVSSIEAKMLRIEESISDSVRVVDQHKVYLKNNLA